MKKILKYLLIVIVIISCNKHIKKNYDEKGELTSIFFKNKNKIDSVYYYNDGLLFEKLLIGKINDSSLKFNKNKLRAKGEVLKGNSNIKIGKWFYYNKKDTILVLEHLYDSVKKKSLKNRFWSIKSKNNDTIYTRSNYYNFYKRDSFPKVGDTVRFTFFLNEPHLSYNSEIEFLLPDDVNEEYDFDKYNLIKLNTFRSLKNDGFIHEKKRNKKLLNHLIEFGLVFNKKSNIKLKGILNEFIIDSVTNKRIEHKLYFQEEIQVYDRSDLADL